MRSLRRTMLYLPLVVLILAVCTLLWTAWRQVEQSRLDAALIAAIKHSDANAVTLLLQEGADANAREGTKPLTLWQEVQLLFSRLRHRSGLPAQKAGPTALEVAFDQEVENQAIVKALLAKGAKGVDLVPPEDMAVMEAMLDYELRKYHKCVVFNRTGGLFWDVVTERRASHDPAFREMLLQSYQRSKQASYLLPWEDGNKIDMVNEAILNEYPADMWEHLKQRFPAAKCTVYFCMPGYSADGKSAVGNLVIVSFDNKRLPVWFAPLSLLKQNGHWKVVSDYSHDADLE